MTKPAPSKAAPTVAPKAEITPGESVSLSGAPLQAPQAEVQAPVSKPQVIDFKPADLGGIQNQAQFNANGTISLFDSTTQAPKKDQKFLDKYGPWGVVTGASQGIGAEYARAMAEKGMNVVMIARSGDKMTKLAKQLSEEHGVTVRVLAADLNSADGVEQVKEGTKDLKVGLLVNNAGAWKMGSFLDQVTDNVGLNFGAPLKLSQHFARSMAEDGKGGIINVGSMAAFHGVPGQAAYSGNKGYLQNLTESLHRELKPMGVDVMITNPGPVKGEASTSVYDQSKIPLAKVSGYEVATHSLDSLGKGRSTTVPGWLNRMALGAAVRTMPRDLMSSMAGMILERAQIRDTGSKAPVTPTESIQKSASVADSGPKDFKDKYGPWAVVTGASQGLGAVYAEQLAKKGMNVVIVARSGEKLEQLSKKLKEEYGVDVRSVAADLGKPEGIGAVKDGTKDLDVGLLVNNAGAWQMGNFLENDIHKDTGNLGLNISAPMQLSHEFGNRMKERGGGGIINVGSGAAAHGIPGQATYSAGKGFLQNFTESLGPELRKHGIDVLQTNPAAIKGEASSIYDQSKVPLQTLDPELVVTDSLDKLGKQTKTTPGLFNRVAMGLNGMALSRDQQAHLAGAILKRATKPNA